jgi:hypothetical protein
MTTTKTAHQHDAFGGCSCSPIDLIDLDLASFGVDIEKALDPLDPADFVTMVQTFAKQLRGEANPLEINAVDAALLAADVDWTNLTPAQQNAAVQAMNSAIRSLGTSVPPRVEGRFVTRGRRLVGSTKRSMRRKFDLSIGTSFTEADQATIAAVARNQGNFVTDFYGGRALAVEQEARLIVQGGLAEGLGSDAIATRLEAMTRAQVLGRSPSYWSVVSNSFLNRSRTDTSLKGLAEAAIELWMFEAVLDHQTTDQCRMLHGKVFSVGGSIRRMAETDASSDVVRETKLREPWLQNGKDADGNSILYTRDPTTGERTTIARVLESGVGEPDRIGRYEQLVSDRALQDRGIPQPPLHGRCRSAIVPAP